MSKRRIPTDSLRDSARRIQRRVGSSLGLPSTSPRTQQLPELANANSSTQSLLPFSNVVPRIDLTTLSVGASISENDKRRSAWVGLVNVLKGLQKCSSIFPPLTTAIDGLLNCLKEIPEASQRRQEYCDLASDLTTVFAALEEHMKSLNPLKISSCILNLLNTINQEIGRISNQQKQILLSRIINAQKEEENLIRSYRRIESCFRQLQMNATLSIWSIVNEQAADSRLDKLSPVRQARYNSAQSQNIRRQRCNPNTRSNVLTNLHVWSNATESPEVYWMNGMAGTGKTTIAYSLAEQLEETCQLGASFFCSRLVPECRDVNRIIPTIAYQLADFSYSFRTKLCDELERDRNIGTYDLHIQFARLVQQPLLDVKDTMSRNVTVVIDALDECLDSTGTQRILDLLFRHASDLPIKFFVTSRPEPSISKKILSQPNKTRKIFFLHEIEEAVVQEDIKTYLSTELARMSPPPSPSQIEKLALQADNLFIYAATAVRYILPENLVVNSHERLKTMLSLDSDRGTKNHLGIDVLYNDILVSALDNQGWETWEVDNMKLVLNTMICAKEPVTSSTMAGILNLDDQNQVQLSLEHFRSVIHVSESTGLISPLHASFPEYMLSEQRSGRFFCNEEKHHQLLATRCFHIMGNLLRFNICNLESSYIKDVNIRNLKDRISKSIPLHLFYACQHWSSHLLRSDASNDLCASLSEFSLVRLLFWAEVLNFGGQLGKGSTILLQADQWLKKRQLDLDIHPLIHDACMFMKYLATGERSRSTPHIYISSLPFWPKERPMSMCYLKKTRGLLQLGETTIKREWFALHANWSGNAPINSIAISPDGNHIVGGHCDHTLRVWDANSGTFLAGPFRGHTDSVSAVTFSPNNKYIVSGSWDRTIRLWDSHTGSAISDPFKGHAKGVTSVAVSHDSSRIVSGSEDCTIRVWDAQTGCILVGPLWGHTAKVTSVAFLSDSDHIVSGSDDRTVRLWKTGAGDRVGRIYEGHTDAVMSVAVSHDNKQIVSGSADCTIIVWSAQKILAEITIKGHDKAVTSVAFSSDGSRIISGSRDRTIRVWDSQTGLATAGPFKGHQNVITSIATSRAGTLVYSAAYDCVIRVWNLEDDNNKAWELQENGWLTINKKKNLIIWLPEDLRNGLKTPQNTQVICAQGSLRIDPNELLYGKQWQNCYIGF